ncbi:N-acetylglucosaminyl-phosphatidylinositol de-N-acetylase [Pangasianodon hypophthalmus]|uniref:N-acetylglucosaminyl-phosphatidylinositol de-N-acetylase n=1 Tax=Pangasianodon hypophthalmus TaxID=310915 RepID=UPI002307AEB0|nr:N-acetylglucosaminyl-phosphatidylinositol de-N-acetylase [Pangasianodon hypophthalmus]XP_053086441.1 N-acetylglucosaminyl-phosphatidylinositol de-N-acetylase [Pangasianodon hypophthalmus]
MFVLLSVALCFLGYLMCIKLIYNRFNKLWPSSRNNILRSSSRAKDVNSLLSRDPPGLPCRTCETDARALDGVRVLLVTAHPDDECMFFAPAVLKLSESNAAVYLLCLSSGNYYNQGAQRKEELLGSCAVLGIPAHRVTVIDNKELQDDPKTEWSIALTASLILKHITTYSINLVLTFDEGGVSGHANHIAIYKALSHLAFVGRIPEDCQVLSLHTISILRKYLSIFELPISWLLPSSFCCIIGPNEYKKAKEAMLRHRSQLLWFRRLYILFSRYMFVNTFRAVPVEKKDLKFY